MTIDELFQAIQKADNAYVAWQKARNKRLSYAKNDPYGDEEAAMQMKYERAKDRADKAMAVWSETPHKIRRVEAAEAVPA